MRHKVSPAELVKPHARHLEAHGRACSCLGGRWRSTHEILFERLRDRAASIVDVQLHIDLANVPVDGMSS